jgi:signal transduction histidine kinase
MYKHQPLYRALFLTFVIAITCYGYAAIAQDRPASSFIGSYNSFSYRDGLTGHSPHASLISTNGRLWVFTENELNSFDGHTVRHYPKTAQYSPDRFNNLLFEAPDGMLWAGSFKERRRQEMMQGTEFRIYVVDPDNDAVYSFDSIYQHTAPFKTEDVINICGTLNATPIGALYICTRQGKVYQYSKEGFSLLVEADSGTTIATILPGKAGTYWVGLPGRIEKINTTGQTLETHPIHTTPLKLYWASSSSIALYYHPRIHYKDKAAVRLLLLYPGKGISSYLKLNGKEDIDIGQHYMVQYQASKRQWHLIDANDWQIISESSDLSFSFKAAFPDERKGFIPGNYPQQLYFDQDGVGYANLNSQVLLLKADENPFRRLFDKGTNSMRAMVQYRPDTVLMSSYSGIMGYNPEKETTFWIEKKEGIAWLSATMMDASSVLTGGHQLHLQALNKKAQLIRKIWHRRQSSKPTGIQSLYPDQNGWWIGTSSGLARYEYGDTTFTACAEINQQAPPLGSALVSTLTRQDNQLWAGTSKGLYSIDLATSKVTQHLNLDTTISIHHIYWAAPDTCWLATKGNGLWQWIPSAQEIRKYNRKTAGLPNDVIHAIYEDSNGRLWLPSNNGLIWFHPENEAFSTFTRNSGLSDDEFNHSAHLRLPDGRLIFGGVSGAVVFHPDSILTEPLHPPVSLNIVYYGTPDRQTGLLKDQTQLLKQQQRIVLSPLSNMACHLEVHLASYLPLREHSYEYRIEGQHPNWRPMNGNQLLLSDLPYGQYTLAIRGKASPHYLNFASIRLPIVVRKPFYEKWWFWLAIVSGVAAFLYSLIRLRLQQLKGSEQQLLKKVERRTQKIEADRQTILSQNQELERVNQGKDKVMSIIGHEIRGNLFFIGSATRQIIQTLRKADYQSAEALSNNIHLAALRMEGAIENLTRWSTLHSGRMTIQKRPVALRPLLERLVQEHHAMAERKGIRLTLQGSGELTVSADPNAIHICLQNLLRNAIKFTDQQGQVTISCYPQQRNGQVVVKDNGIGMEPQKIRQVYEHTLQESQVGTSGEIGTGLGLNITKELVELQNGSIDIQSEPGKGTTVTISLPLATPTHPGALAP